jgi:hypothetical protein
MKGLTPIITVLIIVVVATSMVTLFWVFVSGMFVNLKATGDTQVNQSTGTLSSCVRVDSVSGNKIYVRNCGSGVIIPGNVNVFLDDSIMNVTVENISVDELECSEADEDSPISVVCPAGYTIKSIESSIYVNASSQTYCANQDTGAYCSRYCDYADSCLGGSSCSFTADNGACGGDPCPNTYKKLVLSVNCNANVTQDAIGKDEVGTFDLSSTSGISVGYHTLRVSTDRGTTDVSIEAYSNSGIVSLRPVRYE